MRRRYTIHRDGDLLVEELDAEGKAIDPEPVPTEDRLPVELVLMSADTVDAKAALLDLLELAFSMEAEGPAGAQVIAKEKGHKLDVLD